MKPPVFDPGWPEDIRALYDHDMQEMWDPSICLNVWNLYHAEIDMYLALAGPVPLKILDIGCAQGTLALLLAERGHQVTAVDIRPQFLEYARSRYEHGDVTFLQGNALEDDLGSGYDLVFANQIIEHLVYPVELCTRLSGMARPGGRLVMTTPNGHYVRNKLPSFADLGDPRDWEHMQFSADGDGHFFAFRLDELEDVFVQAGLRQVRCMPFESLVISGHMKFRHLHPFVPYPALKFMDRMLTAIPVCNRMLSHQLLCQGTRAP
jgi:2-polyprenyl-3-methyl-5-hydroxy-6-metoxy-1,4-benzoquinol methylase